jgi:tetrapyrrole methylase family protein/MazG family protein
MDDKKYTWQDLLDIMNTLRSKEGCPWDIEQTHQTLKKYLLEETYEVMDAIDQNDADHLCEELGDILLQVVFHAQIGKEEGRFNIEDIIHNVSKKMIDRHEHVFGTAECKTAEDVVNRWEKLKKEEKGNPTHQDVLNNIPKNLPSLIRAYKVQQKAALVGFDWDNIDDVWNKILEEIEELKEVFQEKEKEKEKEKIIEELGDSLFALVNLSRFLDIHPEFALNSTTEKFIRRFGFMEKECIKNGKNLEELTLEQMDNLWEKAKLKGGDSAES